MGFTTKIADRIIYIDNLYPESQDFFKDYLIEELPYDLRISCEQADIEAERQQCLENSFSSSYLETLVILRKISEKFPLDKRVLMHGASIAYAGKAFLFTAPSGTGKSTHIRLWRKYLGDKVQIVNGDKPFISLDDSQPLIYGTPWAGKERWQRNCQEELHGICIIERGTTSSIRKLSPAEALPFLLKQIYLPAEAISAGSTLELLDSLLKKVPLYLLTCDISEDAVRCSFEALTGTTYPN